MKMGMFLMIREEKFVIILYVLELILVQLNQKEKDIALLDGILKVMVADLLIKKEMFSLLMVKILLLYMHSG